MGACVTEHEVTGRIGNRLQITLRNARWKDGVERVVVARRVLHGDETQFVSDRDFQDAAGTQKLMNPVLKGAGNGSGDNPVGC